jgi:heme a synthase
LVLAVWLGWVRRVSTSGQRLALHAMALATVTQVSLGITTLLWYVPVVLGTLHQGVAVILLSTVLVVGHLSCRMPTRVPALAEPAGQTS